MTFWVYILECSDGSYYVGSTANLQRRLTRHRTGRGCSFTARRLPVRLVYSERLGTLSEAVRRERQFKGWSRSKKRTLISGSSGSRPSPTRAARLAAWRRRE